MRRRPLDHLPETARVGDGALEIAERPFLGKIDLRGDPAVAGFLAAAQSALGVAPPTDPNTVVEAGEVKVFWLGPDQWLVTTPPDGEATRARALEDALGDIHSAVTVVSDQRTRIAVGGAKAREVLEKLCPLDLHPRAFMAGDMARTHIAHLSVLIHQRDAAPSYDIYIDRTHAEHLWRSIEDAAWEYGNQFLEPGRPT
jgi:sarcosine oxidase subunit gamma